MAKDGKQSAEEIHELVELIENMASVNLVNQLGAKIDVQNAKLSSMEKSQNFHYKLLAWMIGIIGGAITVILTIAMFVLER